MLSDNEVVTKVLGFALPADAKIVLIERESGIDDMLRVKVEMSRASFTEVAQHLPVPATRMTRGAGRLSADKGEWNPRATPGVKSGQIARAEGRYLNIGVAESNDRVTLFVMEHGT